MENTIPKIAAVVVTYNRASLLKNCLTAIERQSLAPSTVYIIDNASTDNTEQTVNTISHKIPYKYIKLKENIGGSGGFHTGMKIANEQNGYDAFWVMDDDGEPEKDCLKNLCKYMHMDFVAPLVLDIENKDSVAFPYLKETSLKEIQAHYGKNGIIENYANPFNGILFSSKYVNHVGYPMKEMFIWGDEDEYQMRAISKGYKPITVISAIHYHPKDRLILYKNFLGKKTIIHVDSPLRRYCKYRNTAYSRSRYIRNYKLIKSIYYKLSYIFYYIFNRKLDIKGLRLFLKAHKDGINSDFTHTKDFSF